LDGRFGIKIRRSKDLKLYSIIICIILVLGVIQFTKVVLESPLLMDVFLSLKQVLFGALKIFQ
jgi:hypothetical protein